MVSNLDYCRTETGIGQTDCLFAKTVDPGTSSLATAEAAICNGPGRGGWLNIESTQTSFNKDQSSLTALNICGLVELNSIYTRAIALR